MEFEKVLVTGGAGLLGRYVVGELQDRCTVTGLDRTAGVGADRWLLGDITDIGAVSAAAEGQHAVIHIAAVPNIWSADPETIMRVNVLGTDRMMSWVSLSLGVVDFGMMPSVGDGSSRCTTATPPFALRQRGSEGSSP